GAPCSAPSANARHRFSRLDPSIPRECTRGGRQGTAEFAHRRAIVRKQDAAARRIAFTRSRAFHQLFTGLFAALSFLFNKGPILDISAILTIVVPPTSPSSGWWGGSPKWNEVFPRNPEIIPSMKI